jgi:hypothetical protein
VSECSVFRVGEHRYEDGVKLDFTVNLKVKNSYLQVLKWYFQRFQGINKRKNG